MIWWTKNNTILQKVANLLSTSDIYELIEKIFAALTWVAIIVTAYIILEGINGDDDPDLPA
jgi:hypothetical protein